MTINTDTEEPVGCCGIMFSGSLRSSAMKHGEDDSPEGLLGLFPPRMVVKSKRLS